MPHSTYTGLYTIIVSARDVSPAKMPEHYLLNRQWVSILPGTSCPSLETNRSPTASSYSYFDHAGWCLLGLGQMKLVAVLF